MTADNRIDPPAPSPSPVTLADHLALAYQARAVGRGSVEEARTLLAAAVADPAFRSEAAALLATLTDEVCQRCVISTMHREALREALGS